MPEGALEARVRALINDVGTPTEAELTAILKQGLIRQEMLLGRAGSTLYRTQETAPTGWATWTGYTPEIYADDVLQDEDSYSIDAVTREVTFIEEVAETVVITAIVWVCNLYYAAADWLETLASSSTGSQVVQQGSLRVEASTAESYQKQADDFRRRGQPSIINTGIVR